VRVGIGRPTGGGRISYVLGRWTAEERAALSTAVGEAADAVETILTAGLQQAMNQHNTRSDA
ncbi:MAG: aminoacyl-tRNA hydrolase, partial [Chloroflexota bacterium]|nr:aminoacyl-tRNA hydrolase [Chloroflexota bacterium]